MSRESAACVSSGPANLACSFDVKCERESFAPSVALVCAALQHSTVGCEPQLQSTLASLLIVPDSFIRQVSPDKAFRHNRALIGLTDFVQHHLTRKQQRAFHGYITTHATPLSLLVQETTEVSGSEERPLRVLMVTFNQGPWSNPHDAAVRARVKAFLLRHQATSDIITLATQEADDTLPSLFSRALHGGFELLAEPSLWQMKLGSLQLHVWVRRGAFHQIDLTVSDVMRCGVFSRKTVAKGCAYAGVAWQRTAESVRQQALFASVHLPSDQDDVSARSECLVRIVQQLDDVTRGQDVTLFVMGDLNYRTHGKVGKRDYTLRKQISEYQWNEPSSLVFHDQLDRELKKNDDLLATGLYEIAPREFCPTCKFHSSKEDRGQHERRRYDDMRYPSWCDRILVRDAPINAHVQCLEYKNWSITPESDHDAVFAIASITAGSRS